MLFPEDAFAELRDRFYGVPVESPEAEIHDSTTYEWGDDAIRKGRVEKC